VGLHHNRMFVLFFDLSKYHRCCVKGENLAIRVHFLAPGRAPAPPLRSCSCSAAPVVLLLRRSGRAPAPPLRSYSDRAPTVVWLIICLSQQPAETSQPGPHSMIPSKTNLTGRHKIIPFTPHYITPPSPLGPFHLHTYISQNSPSSLLTYSSHHSPHGAQSYNYSSSFEPTNHHVSR
jgi:hypothetical protein